MTQRITIPEQVRGLLVGNSLATGYLPTILGQIYVVPVNGIVDLNIVMNNEDTVNLQTVKLSIKRLADGVTTEVFSTQLDAPGGKGNFQFSALSSGDIILGITSNANVVKFLIAGLTR